MSLNELMQILGPDTCKQMIRDADAENEAVNGLFAEDYYENVVAEDRPPSPRVSLYDDIPMPRDPYGCANPVSDDEEWPCPLKPSRRTPTRTSESPTTVTTTSHSRA